MGEETQVPPPVTEAAAPAPAAAAAQPVKFADPDAHVVLKTARGDDEIVPISSLVKDAQIYKSGQQLLDEGKELARQNRLDQEHAASYRRSEEELSRDPDRYVQGIMRRASLAKGGPIELPHQNTIATDDSSPTDRNTSATDERIRRLEEARHQDLVRQHQSNVESEVRSVIDEYPIWKDQANSGLRQSVEQVLLAAKALDQRVDLRAIARTHHSNLMRISSAKQQAIRDTREERANTMPAISPQNGAPDTKALEQDTPKAEDLKNGEWARKARAFLARASGGGSS